MKYPIKAECQCGQVGYVLKKAPSKVMVCHCQECQKLSTGPFSVTAVCSDEDVEFFGEFKEWRRTADSGNVNAAKFCPECGNRIYHYNPKNPSRIKLKLRPVDKESAEMLKPDIHVWASEKLDWVDIPADVKVCQKNPE